MSDNVFTVRASSWGEFFDCSLRWYYKHVEGVTAPSSMAAHLGTALHESTAAFDAGRINGSPLSIADSTDVFVDALHRPAYEVAPDESMPIKTAESIGIRLHSRYCAEVSPQFTWKAVEIQIDGIDVVTEYATIRLTGKADRLRVRATSGGVGISDVKSGKRAVGTNGIAVTKGHRPQLGTYELLTEQVLGEPITEDAQIIGMQTTDKARVGVGSIKGARALMVGDGETEGLISIAARMMKAGLFPPNPKSFLCSRKYCPAWNLCKYHDTEGDADE